MPPATGIVHQVNLEFLATVVQTQEIDGQTVAMPDTLVGTDSHTTMVNGLGVLGWGVGGIEAEAVLLGQPLAMLTPAVIGVRLTGKPAPRRDGDRPGAGSYRDAAARGCGRQVRRILRRRPEQPQPGRPRDDRQYVARVRRDLRLLPGRRRNAALPARHRPAGRSCRSWSEAYTKAQGLFRTDDTPEPVFNKLLELDLDSVEPSVAGPRRPQDRVPLGNLKRSFWQAMRTTFNREIRPDDVAGQGMIRWVGESGHSSDPEEVPTLNRTRTDLYQGEGVPVRMDGHEMSH